MTITWDKVVAVVDGKEPRPPFVGFCICVRCLAYNEEREKIQHKDGCSYHSDGVWYEPVKTYPATAPTPAPPP